LPRLTHLQLPPGSAFKPLIAVAVLESRRIDPDEPIHCRGYLDEPDRDRCLIYRHYGVGHGDVTLEDALCRSCNVYFFTAARRIGPEAIVEWAERFGFGRATGIDLPGEYAGSVPCPPALRREREKQAVVQAIFSPFAEDGGSASPPAIQTGARETWYPGDTLGLAIGQSRLTVTPLQIVRMMAAIANGGYLVTPHVVRRIHPSSANDADAVNLASDADHAPLTSGDVSPPPVPIRGLSPSTLQRVRAGLSRVVSHPQGTGHRSVYLEDVSIAGKTGTAETGRSGEDHAWFVGYVPADAPRFAFVVVLDRGGSGGAIAGPPARKVVEAMLDLGLLSNARETSRE
jgi:penicillin-binding protein 2